MMNILLHPTMELTAEKLAELRLSALLDDYYSDSDSPPTITEMVDRSLYSVYCKERKFRTAKECAIRYSGHAQMFERMYQTDNFILCESA